MKCIWGFLVSDLHQVNSRKSAGRLILSIYRRQWRRGVVVITIAQLHSTKPELRFCAGSNPARGVSRFAMVRISDNGPGWN